MGPLGALLGALGAALGASWALLGAFFGHLGAILRPPKAHRKRNGDNAHIIHVPLVLKDLGALGEVLRGLREHLEPSCGPLGASWRHDGGHLERSCAILRHLGGHLGASEALLELSWAILDALTPRDPLPKIPGRGGGGYPSPKGRGVSLEEDRKISLDRLSPRGLAG